MAGSVLIVPISPALPDILEILVKAVIGGTVYGVFSLVLNIANCRTLVADILQKFSKSQDGDMDSAQNAETPVLEASE